MFQTVFFSHYNYFLLTLIRMPLHIYSNQRNKKTVNVILRDFNCQAKLLHGSKKKTKKNNKLGT